VDRGEGGTINRRKMKEPSSAKKEQWAVSRERTRGYGQAGESSIEDNQLANKNSERVNSWSGAVALEKRGALLHRCLISHGRGSPQKRDSVRRGTRLLSKEEIPHETYRTVERVRWRVGGLFSRVKNEVFSGKNRWPREMGGGWHKRMPGERRPVG